MYKYKKSLVHGLLLASLVVFPVVGFSDITTGSGTDMTDKTVVVPKDNEVVVPKDTKKDLNGTGPNVDKDKTTNGVSLGWFYYGRSYWYRPYYHYFPYRPYFYRPYYYNFNYWPYRPFYYQHWGW